MATYKGRGRLTVTGYFDFEIEADTLEELREKVTEHIEYGGDDERVEIDWESCEDYELVRVEDEAGKPVELPPPSALDRILADLIGNDDEWTTDEILTREA